ncbi:efflux RND transporter periplasmic adaptor subunit [Cellvibrio japonicus]|uniref:RND efflux membrane fusion protein n=1 Tax=Cellvibrio japonicus (strain Ueda107) TaxID=498211 RepID=B3PK08_CELJU|nr:efflux RND transporter periplasmic adaptor subunit [Cellvibrio japonicus]ACE84550.1 RND efflux membrane fusion protein [Cellvibrio japonicus Ueda107]QEI12776.1 efflux RND transporter periplasmic adaptor subunit [Cellvibrio japonicus]QEI16350.1 efflux RND transporter periplasmic adaptor subunit [Cellvibrio japonicus]QEI19928.1 efflux RND transporter periplasmic adaptor subunit [Cellvibrio japonicus]
MRRLPPCLLSGFCTLLLAAGLHAQTPGAQLVDVITQPVSIKNLSTRIEALGTLRANESITLTPNVTKTVTRINFEDGQRVAKGQVLVEMTSREESALLEEARFNTDEARKQLDRVDALVKRGAASHALLDQRVREYEAARARYNATESRLKDLILLAPFNGVVGLRNVSVGALVSPGDQITTLNDDSRMKLDFTVPAIYMRNLTVGLSIEAKSDDLGGKIFKGKVFSIDNQIDQVTRAITVRALLDNPRHELKQGMLMLVNLNAAEREAMVISESALVPLGSNNFVFVVHDQDGDRVLERRQITIGERLAGAVEVLNGLTPGEKLVTHGLQKVRGGQKVSVIAEEKSVAEQQSGEASSLSDLLTQKKH